MPLPPLGGAAQVRLTERLTTDAVTLVGAPGTVVVTGAVGVTAFEGADAGPVPIAFVAVTLNVYAVPLVSPVTVVLVAGGVPVTTVTACAVVPT
jgi:hypothetical protein